MAELFLESLLEIINIKSKGSKQLSFQNYTCEVEVSLDNRKRIDILIKTKELNPTQAIIIENKIYDQNNDPNKFKEYYDFIITEDLNKVGIYLTLDNQTPNHSAFINITHSEWMEVIKKRGIPSGLELKEYVYLNDFFSTINNLTMSSELNGKSEFFFTHQDKVIKAEETRIEAKRFVVGQLEIAASSLNCRIGDYHDYYRSFYTNTDSIFYAIYFRKLFYGESLIEIGIGVQNLTDEIKTKLIDVINIDKYFEAKKTEDKKDYIIYQVKSYEVPNDTIKNLSSLIANKIKTDFVQLYNILNSKIKEI